MKEMVLLKKIIKRMVITPGTPIDDIFRGAVSKEDVKTNINRLLDRADKLTSFFGVPGYSKQTKNDFQRIIYFLDKMDIPSEIEKLNKSYGISEEIAQDLVYDALSNGWSNLSSTITVKTNVNRTELIVCERTGLAV